MPGRRAPILGTVLLIGPVFSRTVLRCRPSLFVLRKARCGRGTYDAAGYFILLSGVSFASSEEVLVPAAGIFLRIDCHLAYSLMAREPPPRWPGDATGLRTRLICSARVKDWLASAHLRHRGNGPLAPNGRKSYLSMAMAKLRTIAGGQAAFARLIVSTPLTTLLRPGEFTRRISSSMSQDARRLRLSITEDDPKPGWSFGHENSPFITLG